MRGLFFVAALWLGAIREASAQPAQAPAARVFAASSLTDALGRIAPLYEAAGHPQPVFNYAASSVLARQIDQGAGADVFISADEAWMDYLAERRLIDPATRVSLLANRLVLIAPADRPLHLRIANGFDLAGAIGSGRLAMADPDSVPAGRYGRAALVNLGVWNAVNGAVVRAENVRAALRLVELGEASAGIVYRTDALASGNRVQIVDVFPQISHPRISYPIAVTRNGNGEGRAFAAFLRSDAARRVFHDLGFIQH
ncbi:MAG: molybdate ABC transporter substrate-binding protein [Proteobacteria bacterium]|nr:molybdate ABC transporter substrate-binding protein [Pseudomonadota bacterium]